VAADDGVAAVAMAAVAGEPACAGTDTDT